MNSTICYDCNTDTGELKLRHKHIWMHSKFCDTCNCDFDTWLAKEREKVARDLVLNDFNHMLFVMAEQGKFVDSTIAAEIYHRMKELARARGYLRFPSEVEQLEQK